MLTTTMRLINAATSPVGAAVAPVRPAHAGAVGPFGGRLGTLPGTERFTAAPMTRDRGIDLFSATRAWSSSA